MGWVKSFAVFACFAILVWRREQRTSYPTARISRLIALDSARRLRHGYGKFTEGP